ncbi:hypothetical protein VQL36_08865 [Chengkuizengella sp. SCS-71B]|uniref:hypothetical protein n=1 Tax=Chengkuizengella sp. SCS-71B TaxID=3115290 RepID=UPI0032C2485C
MELEKGPFVVAQSVSVDDPYDDTDPNVIILPIDGSPVDVLTVDVCVKQPQKTQVSLDSMGQIAAFIASAGANSFEVKYEILRNNNSIAIINDEMDYQGANERRHTNFPNFPVVDNNPNAGINTYVLQCTQVSASGPSLIAVGSRSLKATVFTL